MKKMKASWVLLVILILSCQRQNPSSILYSNFAKQDSLKGSKVGTKNFFLEPRRLTLIDSLLVVFDNKTDSFFHFLDTTNFSLKKSFGVKGRGPKEFIAPEISKRPFNNNLVITNKGKFYFSQFNIDSIFAYSDYFPGNKEFFPPELIIPYNLLIINDTFILGSTSSGTSRIFKFNPFRKKYLESGIDIPLEMDYLNKSQLGQILYSISDFNPNKQMIVNALRFFDRIDFYDYDLSIQKSLLKNGNQEPIFYDNKGELISDKTKFYYIDIFTTDKYIFALYCGEEFGKAVPNIGNYLQIFSWEGTPILEFKLNIGLSSIYVTSDNKKLFGISMHDDQPISIFLLPPL